MPAITGDDLYYGAAHDSAIGYLGHMQGLLGCADAKANGAGHIRHLPDALHHGFQIGADLAAHDGNTQGRYHIYIFVY